MFRGWMQLAFSSRLTESVSPVDAGDARLVAVRTAESDVRVFHATCPHRGAHLGFGGQFDGDAIVCPFHGHRVHLGRASGGFRVQEYRSVEAAGGVFVLLDDALDTGLAQVLRDLDASHHVVPGFEVDIAVPPEYVVENVVDADHFRSVHAVSHRPQLNVCDGADGTLQVDGALDLDRPNRWQATDPADEPVRTRFAARVYSPTVVVTELGHADAAHVVITAATPLPGGPGCRVRVTVAVPRRPDRPATVREIASIISGSRTAFTQDAAVWEHLDLDAPARWTAGDGHVRQFHDFVQRFRAAGPLR